MRLENKNNVRYHIIDEGSEGQKIDNFLLKILKNVPKSHVYKLLRSGQVRVNKKRIRTDFRLSIHDSVRIPPVSYKERDTFVPTSANKSQLTDIEKAILFEDDAFIVLNKPQGIAVHGGSGVNFGVIELLRQSRPNAKFLELVHRIDKDTSGALLIAKKRLALVGIHKQMRDKSMHKKYEVIVHGVWNKKQLIVDLNLLKRSDIDGQNKVSVVDDSNSSINAKKSRSVFFLKKKFKSFTFLEVKLITGRTHQIRVHLSHLGFPIVGDQKYGDFELNKKLRKVGLTRMFLHASEVAFTHPITMEKVHFIAPTPKEFNKIDALK
jgi:23S rRNA pseudouridine955/2504/2580 synthase